eukprot:s1726_g1.t1
MGNKLERKEIHDQIATVPGCLVMDSRGIYDAATRNLSCLHGLRESRAGYELTLSIVQAKKAQTVLRWVCGIAQLADSLTNFSDRKCILQFMAAKQIWRLTDDPSFTAGRKVNKRVLEKKLQEQQDAFINSIKIMAEKNNWPWDDDSAESIVKSVLLGPGLRRVDVGTMKNFSPEKPKNFYERFEAICRRKALDRVASKVDVGMDETKAEEVPRASRPLAEVILEEIIKADCQDPLPPPGLGPTGNVFSPSRSTSSGEAHDADDDEGSPRRRGATLGRRPRTKRDGRLSPEAFSSHVQSPMRIVWSPCRWGADGC